MMPKSAFYLIALLCIVVMLDVRAQTTADAIEIAASYNVNADIVYHKASGQELKLDLYVPKESDKPVPVLVFYHGGGWVMGNRQSVSLFFLPFLEKGFAVANVGYRLAETALAPAAVIDALCGLRWVMRNSQQYKLDLERIVVSGRSAGGYLALMVSVLEANTPFANECASLPELYENTLAPAQPAAVINWFGITDLADLLVEPNRKLYVERWIGGQLNGEEIVRGISPLQYIRAGLPPIMTIHGDTDPIVPYEHAVQLHKALDATGIANELVTVPKGGHGNFTLDQYRLSYSRIWNFLKMQRILR